MEWLMQDVSKEEQPKYRVAVASADPSVRGDLSEAFDGFSVETIWIKGTEELRAALAEGVNCLLCGFWLENGSYREAVRLLKKHNAKVPFLMISTPGSANEYRDYLASLNVGAFDFICYPYQKSEVKRILQSAFAEHQRTTRTASTAVGAPLRALIAASSNVPVFGQEPQNPRAA